MGVKPEASGADTTGRRWSWGWWRVAHETGDLIDGELYPGASDLGNRALKLTLRVVDRCRGCLCGSMIVRMDAGFPEPGLLEGLEKRSVPHIARIRKNKTLDRMAKPYLTQPAGRSSKEPPRVWFQEQTYQAESSDRARRVVLVVLERPGELYLDHCHGLVDPPYSIATRPTTSCFRRKTEHRRLARSRHSKILGSGTKPQPEPVKRR